MYFLKVDDTVLPVPSCYSVDAKDIDSTDSCRSDETGKMHRRRVRPRVRSCSAKWLLNGSQARELSLLLSAPVLAVEMLDTAGTGYYKCDMFADELKSEFYQHQGASEDASYWELSCRLVEY